MILTLTVSLGRVSSPDMLYILSGMGFQTADGLIVEHTWLLFALGVVIALASFVTIFLYKRRVLQMRITIFNLVLKVGYVAVVVLNLYRFSEAMLPIESQYSVTPWLALPLVAAISDYLAHRGILADETVIRMMDRLR